jgi:AcrR family transcriptional regulator
LAGALEASAGAGATDIATVAKVAATAQTAPPTALLLIARIPSFSRPADGVAVGSERRDLSNNVRYETERCLVCQADVRSWATVTRLAANRDTPLTAEEIAAEALRQFDERPTDPSIRSLAGSLNVAPAAIYHHFPSRAAIFQAAVELVWREATVEFLALVPEPLEADPADVLVMVGIATRRAWLAHPRVAPYMAATPEANEFTDNSLELMGAVFERLGLQGEHAAAAFHSYATYMLGGILFAAARKAANEQLARPPAHGASGRRFHSQPGPEMEQVASRETRLSLDRVMELSSLDPHGDEELFGQGLRRLIESFR